jgi:hypothetical protein
VRACWSAAAAVAAVLSAPAAVLLRLRLPGGCQTLRPCLTLRSDSVVLLADRGSPSTCSRGVVGKALCWGGLRC